MIKVFSVGPFHEIPVDLERWIKKKIFFSYQFIKKWEKNYPCLIISEAVFVIFTYGSMMKTCCEISVYFQA